jgi:hypothetical protein
MKSSGQFTVKINAARIHTQLISLVPMRLRSPKYSKTATATWFS